MHKNQHISYLVVIVDCFYAGSPDLVTVVLENSINLTAKVLVNGQLQPPFSLVTVP